MASSSIVIKVKFGKTLRRFNAPIDDKKLALDIVMLREKIRSLFSFDPDVEFTLTYVDEDDDVVTLADDDDLHDVVKQSLNPLRITVKLIKDNKTGESSGTSAVPPSSPQYQAPFETLNSGVSEILKSVPEPLREALAKLPLDLASKATISAPAVAELVEKIKTAYLNQMTNSMAAAEGQSPTADSSEGANSESSTVKEGKVPKNPEVASLKSKKKEQQVQKATEGVKFKDVQPPRPVDLNVPYFDYESFPPLVSTTNGVAEEFTGKSKDKKGSGSEKKNDATSGSSTVPLVQRSSTVPLVQPPCLPPLYGMKQYVQDNLKANNDSGSSSGWAQGMLNATNQCPFAGMPLPSETDLNHGYHHPSRSPHWKRFTAGNGIGTVFHRGVRCDGCGVHPITGPRFKSKVKEDYDLCSVCFAGMGHAADYIRMDRPTTVMRHHMPFKGFHDPSFRIPHLPTLPHALRAPGSKLPRSKLDSRFILDVNVLDGTIMAPFTAFTKIWRMRNNGTATWPRGSQLQWIGGDRLSNSHSVEVEMPADGLLVDKELDIAVDFTAPELPGRYISYWRMASPSGQKFGQRVWVLFQVDVSMKDFGETSINLNLPPVVKNSEVANNQDQLMDGILTGNNFIKVTDSESSSVSSQQPKDKDQEKNFPINDSLIIDNGGVSSTMTPLSTPVGPSISSVFNSTQVETALASLPSGMNSSGLYPTLGLDTAASMQSVSYPTLDFSVMPPAIGSAPPSPSPSPSPTVAVVQPPPPPASATQEVGGDDREQGLLKELEDMGFKQLDLNKEILRMNNYDLEKSVDDLCGVSEWDPMLDELQEMGFADDETNRRLLKKNNGSIKLVVMDLINGEKA